MTNQTKPPGAMVLVPREPTVEMYDAAMRAVSNPEEMPIVANAYNMNSACFRARYQAAISVAEQPPAVGGEPEVQRYSLVRHCLSRNLPGEGGMWMKYADHRSVVAPLLAENADYKAGQERYEQLCEDQRSEIRTLKSRIAQLEASQGEAVAWVIFDNGFIDDHTVVKTLAEEWVDRGLEVTALYRQAQPATAKLEMADVVKAHMEIPHCPVLTSNQCHALAVKLNAKLNGGS